METLLVSRESKKENTVVSVGGFSVGSGNLSFIAGPCSVDDYETTLAIAKKVKASGATLLRGGAFKPRTSPYAFQGLGKEGLQILSAAGKEAGLPVVSEITDISQLDYFENIDILQIGARNSRNYELLRAVGKTDKPVILKRGMGDTAHEILQSAEYIAMGGNTNIILCERGIRSFDNSMRNTFDVGAIITLKEMSHLPVIADPSHAAGIREPIPALAFAAVAAGADGIMLEVHINPEKSLSDSEQALTPKEFEEIVKKSKAIKAAL